MAALPPPTAAPVPHRNQNRLDTVVMAHYRWTFIQLLGLEGPLLTPGKDVAGRHGGLPATCPAPLQGNLQFWECYFLCPVTLPL